MKNHYVRRLICLWRLLLPSLVAGLGVMASLAQAQSFSVVAGTPFEGVLFSALTMYLLSTSFNSNQLTPGFFLGSVFHKSPQRKGPGWLTSSSRALCMLLLLGLISLNAWAQSGANGTTVAGGNGRGSGANQLNLPTGVYVDGTGAVYVVDESNDRIQKWAAGATSGTTVAGGNGPGSGANQFTSPFGVYVDGAGAVYVADRGNHRIQKWAAGATSGTTVAGGNGQGSGANQLNVPTSVYVDGAGAVYVVDSNNDRIQKWAAGATSGTTVAGGNGRGSGANQLNLPYGVYVDGAGAVYVADLNNQRIQKWAAGATSGTTVAGGNGPGSGANQLAAPTGVYVDGAGAVYVADQYNDRIQKWAAGATSGTTVAGGNGPGSGANQLAAPTGVYVDGAGAVYVADQYNDRIQRFISVPTTVTALSPTRNAIEVAKNTNVTVTLSQPPTGPASALTVWSQQAGGKKAGTATVSGNSLTFNPTTDFKPGEVVFATTTTASGLAKAQVYQFTTAAATAPATFRGGSDVGVGSRPYSVAVGDVDGDGDLDFLAANLTSNTVSVRLNDGSGNFSGTTNVGVGSNPTSVAVGDVDGDGDLDILAANSGSNTVSVRLNDGSSNFSGGSDVGVGRTPYSVAVGDVDGDGDLDFLAANTNSANVSVRLNNGDGTFGGTTNVGVGSNPYSVAVGDVDGDGDLDLLAANTNSNTVSVRLNDGSGTFGGTTEVGVGFQPGSVALGDVDGDGDLDFLTANNGSDDVSVRLNDGSGNFSGGSAVGVGIKPRSVALGDWDGDGDLDLLADNTNSTTVNVRLNDGSGNFSGGSAVGVGSAPNSVAVGDVDGDGDLDFLAANQFSNTVSVRLNQLPPPTITGFAAVDNTVCVGSPISFTATVGNVTGAYAFTLSNGTSPLSGTATGTAFSRSLVASGNGAQNFTLTVGDNGFQATATTPVTINALPVAGLTNNGPLTCSQTSVTLTASGGSSYSFSSGATQIGTSNRATVSSAGSYSVTVSDANGCVSTTSTTVLSNTAVVTVSNPPTSTATINTPFSQSFTASGGVGPYTYSLASGSLPAGLSLSTAGVLSGTPTQGGSFTLVVRGQDANGCADLSPNYVLTVNATPSITGFAAVDNTVCVGSPISFTATVGNVTGAYAFTLSNGSSPLSGTATGTAFSRSLTASGNGPQNFTLTVGDNGFTATATTPVTINALPVAGLTNNGPLTCAQTSVTLTASGGSSYSFSSGATQIGTSNRATVSSAGSYSVTVSDANGCVSTTSTTVTGDQSVPTASLTNDGPLSCAKTSVTLTASGGGTYRFSAGATQLNGGNTASVNTAGTYSVTVTSANGCSAVATTTVTGDQTVPTASLTNDGPLSCAKTSVTLTASGGGTYRFSAGATQIGSGNTATVSTTGTYSVTVTSANGCSAVATTTVTGNQTAPTVSISANPSLTITQGETTTLTANVSGGTPPFGFGWSTGSSSSSIAASTDSPYSVTVTGANGCSATASVTVSVVQPSGPFAITAVTTLSCESISAGQRRVSFTPRYARLDGSPVSFSVVNEMLPTTNPGPYTLNLYTDNPVITLSATQSGANTLFAYNWLSACSSSTANTPPTVANPVGPQSATVGIGYTLSLANVFTDAETPNSLVLSVTGLPAGLNFVAPSTISGTPSTSGVSTVSVTATDPGGMMASTSFTLTVNPAGVTPPPPTGTFSITSVQTISCQALSAGERRLTFNPQYAGVNGAPISFSVVNELAPTTNPGPYSLDLYTDNSVVTLQAVQSGISSSFAYNWLSACGGSNPPANTPPTVANPVGPQSATVGVGYTLSLASVFTDAETPNQLTLSVSNLPAGLNFVAPSTISGTPSTSGVSTVTVTATDPGSMSASTSFTLTVNPAGGTPPPTATFSITGVQTISCQVLSAGQRRLTFNPQYAGLDGSPVSFSVVNELLPTTNPGPYSLDLYTDNPVITLSGVQGGVASQFSYGWLSACNPGARQAAEPVSGWVARLVGNPVIGTLVVDITGAEGHRLELSLVDGSGQAITRRSVTPVSTTHREVMDVSSAGGGMLLLRVEDGVRSQTLKVIRQ
jgi:hypothetical protein